LTGGWARGQLTEGLQTTWTSPQANATAGPCQWWFVTMPPQDSLSQEAESDSCPIGGVRIARVATRALGQQVQGFGMAKDTCPMAGASSTSTSSSSSGSVLLGVTPPPGCRPTITAIWAPSFVGRAEVVSDPAWARASGRMRGVTVATHLRVDERLSVGRGTTLLIPNAPVGLGGGVFVPTFWGYGQGVTERPAVGADAGIADGETSELAVWSGAVAVEVTAQSDLPGDDWGESRATIGRSDPGLMIRGMCDCGGMIRIKYSSGG